MNKTFIEFAEKANKTALTVIEKSVSMQKTFLDSYVKNVTEAQNYVIRSLTSLSQGKTPGMPNVPGFEYWTEKSE